MSATICFPMTSRSGLDSPSNVSAFETRIVDRKLHPSTLGSLSSLSAALLDLLPCARVFAQTPSAGTISDHDFHIHDPFHPSLPLHSPSPNMTSESSTIFNNVPCACISIPHASTATASICDNAPGSPPPNPSLTSNPSQTEAASPKSTESTPVLSRAASSPGSTPVVFHAASSPGFAPVIPRAASPNLPHDADALRAPNPRSATCQTCRSTRTSVLLRPSVPCPTSPRTTDDPTAFKDIIPRDAYIGEIKRIVVSMDPQESDVPGLRELKGNAFGNLPRPPESPSEQALWWSHDLCQPTTLVYIDDVITTTYDGLSIVDVTTLPNNHSQFHAYASSPDEHFNGYSDTDSDDDSVYDDLPDLMDPDDEPTTDMFHSIDYFKYYFLYPLPPTPLYE